MITIGDRRLPWTEGMTVGDAARQAAVAGPSVMVEVNGKIVWQKDWDATRISDGAVMKVLRIISGG